MQTRLVDAFRDRPLAGEAAEILNKCVHCGFCTATCPTFQILGDELESPRGRIYLIKQLLEGEAATPRTRLHLDRCLGCRACETTCPSGVAYGRLADIGRTLIQELAPPRPPLDTARRWLLAQGVSRPKLFATAYRIGRVLRPLLPGALANKIVDAPPKGHWPPPRHQERWLLPGGCAQPGMLPDLNAAAARVLDRIGISLIDDPDNGCCGALRYHLEDHSGGLGNARARMQNWLSRIESGEVKGVVITASGCASFVRDYEHLFRNEPDALEDARRLAGQVRDVSELVLAHAERLEQWFETPTADPEPLAFHSPCSLQHGLQIRGVVERLLTRAGYRLTDVADGHLCCGSAGAYSLLQPELSRELRQRKLAALHAGAPIGIASANVGCIAHLSSSGVETPVRHWLEWMERRIVA